MDARIFHQSVMDLRRDMVAIALAQRFTYDIKLGGPHIFESADEARWDAHESGKH